MRSYLVFFVCIALAACGTTLRPTLTYSIEAQSGKVEDPNFVFNANSAKIDEGLFSVLVRQAHGIVQVAAAEIDLTPITGKEVVKAELMIDLSPNNSIPPLRRGFNVIVFEAKGKADVNSFNAPGISVGEIEFTAPKESWATLDVTQQIQSFQQRQVRYFGVRFVPIDHVPPSIVKVVRLDIRSK